MEILTLPLAETLAEAAQPGDAPPVKLEEQEMDILAFQLWQRANYPLDEWLREEEARRCRASCL